MKNIQNKKRILYVITKSNFGGAQRYVYELAANLPNEQYEVAVAFGGSGVLKEKLEKEGIKTYKIKSLERDVSVIKEVRSMFELKTLLKEFKPDVVHLNSSKAGGAGAFIARSLGIRKIIFTAHGWPFYESRNMAWRTIVWFFSYLTTLFSHKVIVVSEHDYKRRMMPLQSHKFIHINTAVPDITFKEKKEARSKLFSEGMRERNKNNLWAVSTGEFNKNKNLLSLLKAVKINNESNEKKIFLSLIGEGGDKDKLQEFVKENNLEQNVSFLGFIDNARTYLKAFDVFLLPSLKEGLPYGLLEAGAAGLYCIASSVGGVPDVIQDGTTGVLIDPTNEFDIAEALKNIPQNSEGVGQILKNEIKTKFSLNQMLQKTIDVY